MRRLEAESWGSSARAVPAPVLATVLAVLVLAAACAGPEPVPSADSSSTTPVRASGLEEGPRRIVTLAPSITEIAFALGLEERIVGVGSFANYPPEARAKPRLGGLTDPNLELLVALDPQLAILLPSEDDVAGPLRRLGIEVMTVESETLEDLEQSILAIARRCGVEPAGRALIEELRKELAPRSVGDGVRVMITIGRQPGAPAEVLVAGPGTFLDELLRRLGAVNVFADAGLRYPIVGLEEILRRDPEVIVELQSASLEAAEAERVEDALTADWDRVAGLPAARSGRVELIAGDFTLIPGPRVPKLYRRLAQALEAR
ncbi:MAG: helical backbone metal receptor [Acidobacteriota bacterium]|nr:helical backbone metal receptor [Acidobacteriota bacterium]